MAIGRVTDRLSRDADSFADATYNNFSNSLRSSRNDVEAVMLSQQFAASARIFYRMVVDRRRNQDLRDAFALLQEHAVVEGDRLDNIAATYLGDPEQFWRLCDANRAMFPSELTDEVGRRLRITLPEGIPGPPTSP